VRGKGTYLYGSKVHTILGLRLGLILDVGRSPSFLVGLVGFGSLVGAPFVESGGSVHCEIRKSEVGRTMTVDEEKVKRY
jgi:hypothetical protein